MNYDMNWMFCTTESVQLNVFHRCTRRINFVQLHFTWDCQTLAYHSDYSMTTSETEQCFSMFKKIETFKHNTMKEGWLCAFAMCLIESPNFHEFIHKLCRTEGLDFYKQIKSASWKLFILSNNNAFLICIIQLS